MGPPLAPLQPGAVLYLAEHLFDYPLVAWQVAWEGVARTARWPSARPRPRVSTRPT